MTDIRAEDGRPLDEEDRLPWLEAVEEDEEIGGPSPLKMIALVVIFLVAIGVIVGGLFWAGGRDSADGDAQLIAAPEGDYKVAPDAPGGMAVEGEGDTAFAASAGQDPAGAVNVDAVPEAPVTQAPPAAAPQAQQPQPQAPPQPQPQAQPRQQAEAPAAAPAGPGGTIQLGAFSSQAGANNAWRALSGRFRYLEPLSHAVSPVETGGRTLYRLRASGPDASNLCARLRVAGETCVVVN